MENYFFDVEHVSADKVFVLIIYDIVDNKQRVKLSKYLQGYGFRVQKSAFEAVITKRKYQQMLSGIKQFVTGNDSVKVYKIIGKGQVTSFGRPSDIEDEDIILV